MGLLEKFDLKSMIDKAMEHIDMDKITTDIMQGFKITDLDIFFVVREDQTIQGYEFIGMAYSLNSARELRDDAGHDGEILKLDLMKMVPLAKKMGFIETVL